MKELPLSSSHRDDAAGAAEVRAPRAWQSRLFDERLSLALLALLLLVAILIATVQASLQLEDMALSLLPRTVLVILLVLMGGFGAFDTMRHLAASWLGAAGSLVHRPWY